jgi:hypothetical protein
MAKRATRATKPRAKRVNGRINTSTTHGRGRPRQPDLPGTEDRRLQPLDDLAAAYADVRDRRIDLTREEGELKAHAIALMHQFDKTIYKHDGIEIRLVAGEEDVKVKVRKATEDEDDDDDDAQPAVSES